MQPPLAGDADSVIDLLRRGPDGVEFVDTGTLADRRSAGLDGLRADILAPARVLTAAARRGDVDAALRGLDTPTGCCAPTAAAPTASAAGPWRSRRGSPSTRGPPGTTASGTPTRPLLITSNDYDVGLYNGDTGVVVRDGDSIRAGFARGGTPVLIPRPRLSDVQTVHTMTIHRG